MSNHISLLADLKAGKNCSLEAAAAIEQLERICAEKDAEIDALGQQLEATKRHALKLDDELSEANALIAMQAEALKSVKQNLIENDDAYIHQSAVNKIDKALFASAESVAAWEAENMLPLQRQVALCADFAHDIANEIFPYPEQAVRKADEFIQRVQATAEAYDREHAAKVWDEAESIADEHYKQMVVTGESNDTDSQGRDRCYARARTAEYIRDEITRRKLELRSANKKDGE